MKKFRINTDVQELISIASSDIKLQKHLTLLQNTQTKGLKQNGQALRGLKQNGQALTRTCALQ
jgi:hypothetical protein